MSEPIDRGAWDRLSPAQIYLLAAIVLGIGVLVAPLVYHDFDVRGFFLPWSRATGGARPWAVYAEDFYPDCNYPPVVPYLLTLVERVRRLAHAPKVGALSLTLLKLPSLLAWAACVPLCLVGLRSPFGGSQARVAAVCCALCLPLFINAALWGQWDAITAALILASAVALLHERPAAAGALMGLAFSTKVMVIVAVPAMGVWLLRRSGVKALALAVSTGAIVLFLMLLPHLLAGSAAGVMRTYTGVVGFNQRRTMEACNGWYVLDGFDVYVRGIPKDIALRDNRPALGPMTFRQVGLGMLGGYAGLIILALWRRPTRYLLVLSTAMTYFAFFMLPTEIHGRYVAVFVPLLAMIVVQSSRIRLLFLGVSLTASLCPGLELGRQLVGSGQFPAFAALVDVPTYRVVHRSLATLVSLVNIALFALGTVAVWKEAAPRARGRAISE